MARLIDADIDAENYVTVWETDEEYGKQTVMAVDDLQYLPTVDAVEVVHGEWIVDECDTSDEVPSFSWIDFHCSECSTDYGLEEGQYGWYRCGKIPYNFCPNCGSRNQEE